MSKSVISEYSIFFTSHLVEIQLKGLNWPIRESDDASHPSFNWRGREREKDIRIERETMASIMLPGNDLLCQWSPSQQCERERERESCNHSITAVTSGAADSHLKRIVCVCVCVLKVSCEVGLLCLCYLLCNPAGLRLSCPRMPGNPDSVWESVFVCNECLWGPAGTNT